MKDILRKRHGYQIKQTDPISTEDENMLWSKGVFGQNDSKTLQLTLFFYAYDNMSALLAYL